jgi:hypothetical protein
MRETRTKKVEPKNVTSNIFPLRPPHLLLMLH